MTAPGWVASHRQLVSAIISLVLPDGRSEDSVLRNLGYELISVELPITDRDARLYQLDLLLLKDSLNLSLLVDCKAGPSFLKAEQIGSYMNTSGTEVIVAGALRLDRPREHLTNPIFFILPDVEHTLASLVSGCSKTACNGWGMVRIEPNRFVIVHDELSDRNLSASLTAGWNVRLEDLPLERLPYEPNAPRWELADVIFRTLMMFFIQGPREFDVQELCAKSNDLWPFLEGQHDFIQSRVRHEMRTIRRTALKGWITRVEQASGTEERWKFVRKAQANRGLLNGFARRQQTYVSILRSNGDPRANDFVRIDPEQLTLPLIVPEVSFEETP